MSARYASELHTAILVLCLIADSNEFAKMGFKHINVDDPWEKSLTSILTLYHSSYIIDKVNTYSNCRRCRHENMYPVTINNKVEFYQCPDCGELIYPLEDLV